MNRESNFPIDVYCKLSSKESARLNPSQRLLNCLDQSHLSLKVPSILLRKFGSQKLIYSFTEILDGHDSNDQSSASLRTDILEKISLPLARNLVEERNGLLITNGIDESAETGCARRGGQEETLRLFQLVVESVLKLIEPDHHTNLFKPSKSNWFKTRRHSNLTHSTFDDQLVCSLFASCVELRNNEIYDLFAEGSESEVKHLGRDSQGMAFVKEANQIEIQSAQHVIELIDTMRHNLEPDSSFLHEASTEHTHSHVVLTLKLVQAKIADLNGANRVRIKVNQLTLVDLARHDRNSRIKPKEATFLNGSSMALRNCLEIYKENALNERTKKIVPYRDSKLTILLKNYFEPQTMIKLVLCFDKNATQFEKIFNVLKFANLTSDKQTTTGQNVSTKPLIDSEFLKSFVQEDRIEANDNVVPLEMRSPNGEMTVEHLMSCIEEMRFNKNSLIEETTKSLLERQIANRALDTELHHLKNECNQYEALNEAAENRGAVETVVVEVNDHIEQEIDEDEEEEEEDEQNRYLNRQSRLRTKSIRKKRTSKFAYIIKEDDEDEEEEEINANKSDKRQAPLPPLPLPPPPQRRVDDTASISSMQPTIRSRLLNSSARFCGELVGDGIEAAANTANECFRFVDEGVPVGSRRNRSRRPHSADVWLDHQPRTLSKLDTVLQPKISRKRSVKILQFKDTKKSSKYLLTHQQQDEDGEIKTNLIKGDILRSAGGGSNVIFTDVEILRVRSPKPERFRREATDSNNNEHESDSVIEKRCAIGIEGHRRARN